jgi:hypothetical protein
MAITRMAKSMTPSTRTTMVPKLIESIRSSRGKPVPAENPGGYSNQPYRLGAGQAFTGGRRGCRVGAPCPFLGFDATERTTLMLVCPKDHEHHEPEDEPDQNGRGEGSDGVEKIIHVDMRLPRAACDDAEDSLSQEVDADTADDDPDHDPALADLLVAIVLFVFG